MAIVSQYTDAVEPIADTDAEAATNALLYGVVWGCAVAYDAADLTYDVAVGEIIHNGVAVQVAAQLNAGTLVPDITNPRWATIYLDSTGVEGLVHGTAAADPSKPETGDNVAIAMILVPANETIANNITTKLDKRVITTGPREVGRNTTAATTTSTSAVDLVTVTPVYPIGINDWAILEFEFRKTATAANAVGFGLKINATTVLEASGAGGGSNQVATTATNRAEAGFARYIIPPRSTANYGFGIDTKFIVFTTAGAIANGTDVLLAGAAATTSMNAVPPQAAITSVTIRAINATANNNAEVKNAVLYALRP